MAFFDTLYKNNFLEYASYVIKERAIPHLEDGLKPVQRRIMHSLFELDDGKFHKVANVVGHTMKYHPHGDASIFSALVVLANKDILIEKQGNYGNPYTGDGPSAARYIECRLNPIAKEVLYNPELTRYEDSYDGRNREPLAFPAKIPLLLAHGTEGIAVGMATKILPHNLIELLNAQINFLEEKDFQVVPDFPTGGYIDVSDYNDGNGKVLVRAKLDVKDPKKIIIREIPFGSNTESLISSIEDAAKKNKVKVSTISDFTAEDVEIEVKMARGTDSRESVDAFYAFTDCELSISANLMVVKEQKPCVMSVTEVIRYNTNRLVEILKGELLLEESQLNERLHAKTLERIFIENRVYKKIEKMDSPEKVENAVFVGLEPYEKEIKGEVTKENVETLLKIPIRRISLYDINKAKKEMAGIRKRLKEIKESLNNIVGYATAFLKGLIDKYSKDYPRKTEIRTFKKVIAREAASRNLKLRYEKDTGYLGTTVNGNVILEVSAYDRILIIRKNGDYSVVDVPEKLFVDKGMRFCGFIEKDRIYTVLLKDKKTAFPQIKRCQIEKFIINKAYTLVPEGTLLLDFTINSDDQIHLKHKPKPRMRILEETLNAADYPIRSPKAKGIRLASRELKNGRFK